MRFPLIVIISLLALLTSCEEDSKVPQEIEVESDKVDLAEHLGLDSGEVKIFTMPAPLQVSTLLNINDVSYQPDLLIPAGSESSISSFNDAIQLGMLIVDLGYETVYGHHDIAMQYVGDIKTKMDNLNIESVVSENLLDKFENYKGNPDSLYQAILEGYENAHSYFYENDRDDVGILIVTGAFLEGAYFATQAQGIQANIDFDNLIIQHKLYIDNIVLLADAYKAKPEMAELMLSLNPIKGSLSEIDVYYNDSIKSHVLRKPILDTEKTDLMIAIESARNRFAFEE